MSSTGQGADIEEQLAAKIIEFERVTEELQCLQVGGACLRWVGLTCPSNGLVFSVGSSRCRSGNHW